MFVIGIAHEKRAYIGTIGWIGIVPTNAFAYHTGGQYSMTMCERQQGEFSDEDAIGRLQLYLFSVLVIEFGCKPSSL